MSLANVRLVNAQKNLDNLDAFCAHRRCRNDIDPDAPVALCTRHLQLAFSYVLQRDRPDIAGRLENQVQWAASAKPTGWVYFIRVGDLIKIGYTAKPQRRFVELQPSEVLHMEPGTFTDEKRCQTAFAHLRVEGELFRPETDLLTFIAGLQRESA